MNALYRKLIRDLWGRKGSLVALIVIMVIGVGTYVGMASVWRDLDGARGDYYRNQRLAHFVVDFSRCAGSVNSHAGSPGRVSPSTSLCCFRHTSRATRW